MNIFEDVKILNLPVGEYAVVGGGVLAAHGLREYQDVDLIVTKNLYEYLHATGWAIAEDKENVIRKGKYEADSNFHWKEYRPDIDKLIKEADIINGIPFIKLQELLIFKKNLARNKDLEDIKLIEKYLIHSHF